MKPQTASSRFDENETDHLIATFGVKMSPEKWSDMQNFLSGQREEFLTQERTREENAKQKSNRRDM